MDHPELRDLLVRPEIVVSNQSVPLDPKVLKEGLEEKGSVDQEAHPESLDPKDSPVQPDLKDVKDLRDLRDRSDPKDSPELLEVQDPLDLKDQLDPKDPMEPMGPQDLKDLKDLVDPKETPAAVELLEKPQTML